MWKKLDIKPWNNLLMSFVEEISLCDIITAKKDYNFGHRAQFYTTFLSLIYEFS